jgi:2-polyprenyl-6-methoxyphenol hydroxylase-like FAD-dependent oxidoreductase
MTSAQAHSGGAAAEVPVDVLVVGAGPTGLALAAELAAFGVSVQVVDRKAHPVAESRALAIQPRTLEVLRGSVTGRLLDRGNPAVRLQWHAGGRTATLPLFDMDMDDTAYPFLLFLSQAETEQALVEHLSEQHVEGQWNTRFMDHTTAQDGTLLCDLVDALGRSQQVGARYLVGCDGAHSLVRERAGIAFTGGRYPQTFLLADSDAQGLEPGAAHVWFGAQGPLFFFPLLRPAAWRLLTARPGHTASTVRDQPVEAGPIDPGEIQSLVDQATRGTVQLDTPVWSSAFQIHHRQADTYRAGSVFVAGDAAHIHSPAGAQGMNTGIQDAVNLGWKLALVCRGVATERLLDTYELERRPVGAFVLRFTDRAFTAATSSSPLIRFARTHLAPRGLTLAGRLPRARAIAFRTVSQLDVRYPDILGTALDGHRGVSLRGTFGARAPRPRPGERLPDIRVEETGHTAGWFLDELTDPAFHLLLCGSPTAWDEPTVAGMASRRGALLRTHHVSTVARTIAEKWGVHDNAHLLVRPDGHVAYRREDTDLSGVEALLDRWFKP